MWLSVSAAVLAVPPHALMWECQCVYHVSTVEVWCTHLLPPQAAVPPPVQGTGPPSFHRHLTLQSYNSVGEVGDLRRGYVEVVLHIRQCCVACGGVRACNLLCMCLSWGVGHLGECIHVQRGPYHHFGGSVLCELWVWGEFICLQVTVG